MEVKKLLEEYAMLNDAIYQLRNQILDEEIKETQYECRLWLETNFKELKLSNKELREAYVKQKMGEYISKVGKLRNDLKFAEGELNLCKTKISLIKELGIDLNDSEEE